MRIVIVRRAPKASFSMDVYADGLVSGLKAVRPTWDIIELVPELENPKRKHWSSGLYKYYQRYWRFPAIVKAYNADCFHIIDHSDGHISYTLKAAGKPHVVTCHDLINFLHPENIADQARISFISTAAWRYAVKGIRQANHILAVSTHTAKDIINVLNVQPTQITVVPNAVEPLFRQLPAAEVEAFRQRYNLLPDQIYLLNVGSNHPRKNIETVLSTVQTLRAKGLPVHLLKAGANFTSEQAQFIQTHQLDRCITHLGKPDKPTLVQIYNAADILLAPSLYEGFGMTVLEAMSCGTPVITSNTTSLPEVAGDAAVLVDPTDVEAIVAAVCRIRDDRPHRQTLIEQGLNRVQQFTWEKTAEQIAQVYEAILKRHSS